ncbi:zinc finger transcription factor ace1 [Delitschia confertaspora ATCC 74209]|uniref:Zinc finger transcription factor ace1 n=1 Tax=Delitschia confertaspora ATCC 74209 TaxID=1513339 RepID=A0A9P4MYQ8_9PLEO|nr:zinc finger transcription factor ace1 [Delitschia confertaspora ATCC 74209]
MSPTHTHPRRRPLKATNPQAASLNTHTMQLRKSGTFHSPTNLSSDLCGLDNHPYMPKRSSTSVESLEDLLQDAGVQRVANILKDFDQKLAGHKASSADSNILSDPEVLPVPSFLLDNTSLHSTLMDIDPKPDTAEAHDHASDSGLGSSVSGSKYGMFLPRLPASLGRAPNIYKDGNSVRTRGSIATSVATSHSAITRSFSALGASEDSHTLGEYACKQIHDHIIKPILAEESLKDFHPLIQDVPRRIGDKNITNLRDLEKTLVFLAPEFSASPASYQRFCERSIQLLHTTVDCLSEQDQRLPSDRPYTNNYFLDLIEQIRRYAAIMAATRENEANGEELDEMDYSTGEKLALPVGRGHNLAQEKEGRVNENNPTASSKRALSDEETDDDSARRSMARRRKSEKPGDVLRVCRDCKKEFKRPCDLTKHEKTHSRPWKCTESKCKYFELGWPTEKERDRHVNDKHSSAPPQYKCLYPPCTYASKRESNCKQHMEKAHGWEYVRSKSNGRRKAPSTSERSPPTPLTPYLGTPRSSLATPMTPFLASPSVPLIPEFSMGYNFATPAINFQSLQDDYRRESIATDVSGYTYSSGPSPIERPTSFEDAVTPEDITLNHNDVFHCGGFNNNLNTSIFQQPTPAMSTGFQFDDLDISGFSAPHAGNTTIPHFSPGAQGDVTLLSPGMQMDEGFEDGMVNYGRPTGDFTLYDNNPTLPIGINSTDNFFPELSQFGGQFDLFNDPPMQNAFEDMMGFDGSR